MRAYKKEILLVMPPPWGIDVPPLGVASLSSYLRKKDISTEIFDLNIELFKAVPEKHKYLWSMNYSDWWHNDNKYCIIRKELSDYIEPLLDKILRFPQDIIGVSLPTNCPNLITEEIIKKIKTKNLKKLIILGGISISIKKQRDDLLAKAKGHVDYCVIGEGEETLFELLVKIFNAEFSEIRQVEGVLTKETMHGDTPKAQVKELDKLPFPTFQEFDFDKYTNRGKSLPMELSRGCIGNCPFCDFKSISPKFKMKSPRYVLEQIKFYLDTYKTAHLTITDSTVNGNIENLEQVCDLLIEHDLNIGLSALAIPRKEMNYELLVKMRKAGFYRLEYGVESGSNKVLRAMKKIFTAKTAERVIRDTYKAGIKTFLYLIVGYPEEDDKEFCKTEDFLKRNARYITMIKSVNPLCIMAGSDMFNNPEKYNILIPSKNSDREWCIGETNTYDIRKNRVLEIKLLANNNGIPFTEEAELLEFTLGFSNKKAGVSKRKDDTSADIILILCPPWDVRMPPLGLAYLSRCLREKNFKPTVYDVNIDTYSSISAEHKDLWDPCKLSYWMDSNYFTDYLRPILNQQIHTWADRITSLSTSMIGFSVNRANLYFTIELAKAIKKKKQNITIIFGGHACSIEGERKQVPKELVDIFVLGEGEKALLKILRLASKNQRIKDIPGCVISKEGSFSNFIESSPIANLDSIPFPNFDEFRVYSYEEERLPLLGSRGCVNRCTFCNDCIVWPKYRYRTAKNIFAEIRYHVKYNNVNAFEFFDLAINNNTEQLENLCDLIISEHLSISWVANFVARPPESPTFFEKMKMAGCDMLRFGIESGSDRILKKMRKPFSVADIEKTLNQSCKAGIKNHINLIVGFPGENENDFSLTRDFIKRNKDAIHRVANIHTFFLTPSSYVEKNYRTYGIILPNDKDFGTTWYDENGNNYSWRKGQALELKDAVRNSNIEFMDSGALVFHDEIVAQGRREILEKRVIYRQYSEKNKNLQLKKTSYKWVVLLSLVVFTFFYVVYFWIYSLLRNKMLLGGRR